MAETTCQMSIDESHREYDNFGTIVSSLLPHEIYPNEDQFLSEIMGPFPAEKCIFVKLTEMSRFREIWRKTRITAKHMQVFEYLTTNLFTQTNWHGVHKS